MRKEFLLISMTLFAFLLSNCWNQEKKTIKENMFLTEQLPDKLPIPFKADLIQAEQLIHRGSFSNDLKSYYFTVSDKAFARFDIMVLHKQGDQWSEAAPAFFNSSYSEHGLSFSPDGNTLFFSSTRPVGIDSVPLTWHLWRAEKEQGGWSEPKFVDIPNLRDKLISHPTITADGDLYFHASNVDYSNMHLYVSHSINGRFQNAEKVKLNPEEENGSCTPYISPKGDYLIYASIGEPLELKICYKNEKGEWGRAEKLPDEINKRGQGNPYITPDGEFLFYACENPEHSDEWQINWVRVNLVRL